MSSLSESSILSGASGSTGTAAAYQVSQSIRFNDDDSAYMHRTPSSGGNQKTFTYSAWIKLGNLGINRWLPFPNVNQAANYGLYLTSSDILNVWIYYSGSWQGQLYPTQVFRDPSAWYHFVLVVDTTQFISSERIRLYVNGSRVTDFSTENYPSQNADTDFNKASEKMWIASAPTGASTFFDGYAAEIHWLDGYAYGPEYFGEFDDYGIWRPIEYTGSYGTNGFKIDGRDSSDLGDDESGNGNDFTTSGLAAHDQVLDSPTNNFCVLNSVDKYSYDSGQTVRGVRDQGLAFISKPAGNQNGFGAGNMAVKSGKWYYEVYTQSYPGNSALGISYVDVQDCATATAAPTRDFGLSNRHTTNAYTSWFWGTNSSTSTGLTPYGQDVILGVYTDFDNNEFKVYKDGVLYGSVDFDSTSPTDNLTSEGLDWVPRFQLTNDQVAKIYVNFGQDDSFNGYKTSGSAVASDDNGFGKFYYTPLTGYLAICSRNLGA